MSTSTTTIKVPKGLRDRLAAQAQREHISLAAVITRALDEAEERKFWSNLQEEHSSITVEDYDEYEKIAARQDDLTDPDDDALSARDDW